MGSLIKLVAGVAIGAGIGVVGAKLAQRRRTDGDALVTEGDAAAGGIIDRIRQASEAAHVARAEREAQLQSYFRRRVNDPTAFTASEEPVQ